MSMVVVCVVFAASIGAVLYALALWRALWRLYGQQRLPERDGEHGWVS